MEPIYIPQLEKAVEKTETISVHDYLPELETLTPVEGTVQVIHRGSYLEVSAKAEAIVTLSCDRCLQQYNHRLVVDASELIWFQKQVDLPEEDGLEQEVAFEDLVESVDPEGYFYPVQWLYEQFCLATPQRQLCDQNCKGIQIEDNQPAPIKPIDSRWASLENLKNYLN